MTPTTLLARIRATQDLQRGGYISPHQVLADTPRVNLCAWHDDEVRTGCAGRCAMTHGSLFSGIGGFDLASQWMGWENMFHCEWNPFGQKILKHYWPEAVTYDDITKTDFTIWNGRIDILTGGFPCQPYSAAGKRLGKEDERHLWPEMLRAIREIRPRWVVGENVFGLINWNDGMVFDEVQADLEAEGYEVQPYVLPAVAVDAPHRRDRVWFVAYAKGNGSHRTPDETSGKAQRQNRQSTKQFKQCSEIRPTPDTDSRGWDEGNKCQHDNDGKRAICENVPNNRNKVWCEPRASCNDGPTPNTGSFGRLDRCDNREERHVQTNIGATSQGQPKRNRRKCGISQTSEVASDTNRNGLDQRNGNNEVNTGKRGFDALGDVGTGIGDGHTPHPNRRRQPSKEHRQTESGRSTKTCVRSDWADFPTQPPICGRNDGISTELDGITFPKWRNESIKAYGNAIVPQVVYQIFQAIQQYEETLK